MRIAGTLDNFGFCNAAKKLGYDWQVINRPLWDIYDEFSPDLWIFHQIDKNIQNFIDKTQIKHITSVGLSLADDVAFSPVPIDNLFKCDIVYIGEYNKLIKQLCYPIGNYHIKVYNPNWGMPQNVGKLSIDNVNKLLCSSKMVITDELHLAMNALCGGNPTVAIGRFWPNSDMFFCENIESLKRAINSILNWTSETKRDYVSKCYSTISSMTYINFLKSIL